MKESQLTRHLLFEMFSDRGTSDYLGYGCRGLRSSHNNPINAAP